MADLLTSHWGNCPHPFSNSRLPPLPFHYIYILHLRILPTFLPFLKEHQIFLCEEIIDYFHPIYSKSLQ